MVGTFRLLEAARAYGAALPADQKARFRFLQVSTDEVYGSLSTAASRCRGRPMRPIVPRRARLPPTTLVRSFHRTYGLPVMTTNCSNNYGPCHFPKS